MEEARDPQESLKIKNHQGRMEWGTDAASLGISPVSLPLPHRSGATPVVSMQKAEAWAPHLMLCALPRTSHCLPVPVLT